MKKDIYLPHINYTVKIREKDKIPEQLKNVREWVQSNGQYSCAMYLDKTPHPGDLAHELIHVLQFICLERNINFILEQEHMGYIMHYLMGQIMGWKWQ